MRFELNPYKAIEKIKLGGERKQIRELLGQYKEFKKSEFGRNTTDDFEYFHIFYDDSNLV